MQSIFPKLSFISIFVLWWWGREHMWRSHVHLLDRLILACSCGPVVESIALAAQKAVGSIPREHTYW